MIFDVSELKEIRPIAANIQQNRIAPYIDEVEHVLVIDALGAELYEKIEKDKDSFSMLIDGGFYDGLDGREWFAGLRQAVSYLVYARVIRNNDMNVTAFGAVVKNGKLSEQADGELVARMSNEALSFGEKHLNDVVKYCSAVGLIKDCAKMKFYNKIKIIGE